MKVDIETRELYRVLDPQVALDLDVSPAQSLRDSAPLDLGDSWLDRIDAWHGTKSLEKSAEVVTVRDRAVR